MKKLLIVFLFIISVNSIAQESRSTNMGQTTLEELQMTQYKGDSSAPAVVLYDEVNYYFSDYKKRIYNRDYYKRVKVLTNEGLDQGTITFTVGDGFEILQLEGITYNLDENKQIIKTNFDSNDLITNKINNYYTEVIINFPNVKQGSVLELKFRLSSEGFNIDDWYFQKNIPVKKSRLMRMTPTTMDYIVNLTGTTPLSNKETIEKTKCYTKKRSSLRCRFSAYEMENVPAFKKEPHAPNRSVLVSKLDFRFSYFLEPGYRIYKMMTQWKQFDSVMKNYYFHKEITKRQFFKRIIPDSLLSGDSKLNIAKRIFHRIQDHYSWNGYTGGDTSINIRLTYKNRSASVNLIAETLYNSLKAAGIECYYVAVSTNGKGPVDWNIPSRRDFDYTVVKAVIDGKSYFLDPTDKSIGFGYVQPFANVKDGRVLDYTVVGTNSDLGSDIYKGSYREKMTPIESPSQIVTSEWNFSDEKGFFGRTNIKRNGYEALSFRRNVTKTGKTAKQEDLQEKLADFDILDYQIRNLEDRDKRVEENIQFELAEDEWDELKENTSLNFYPIQGHIFPKNPFVSDTRTHPIDFLFPRNFKYRYSFTIPEGYDVVDLPNSARFLFPNRGGSYLYQIKKTDGKVRIFINLKMLSTYYDVEQYGELKKLFTDIFALENAPLRLVKL